MQNWFNPVWSALPWNVPAMTWAWFRRIGCSLWMILFNLHNIDPTVLSIKTNAPDFKTSLWFIRIIPQKSHFKSISFISRFGWCMILKKCNCVYCHRFPNLILKAKYQNMLKQTNKFENIYLIKSSLEIGFNWCSIHPSTPSIRHPSAPFIHPSSIFCCCYIPSRSGH